MKVHCCTAFDYDDEDEDQTLNSPKVVNIPNKKKLGGSPKENIEKDQNITTTESTNVTEFIAEDELNELTASDESSTTDEPNNKSSSLVIKSTSAMLVILLLLSLSV